MKYLFLDTNIFLQFVDFEQIPWCKVVACDDATIVITDTVIQEIDKHKDFNKGKIQAKAKKVSKRLADILLSGGISHIKIEARSFPKDLSDSEKVKYDLDSKDNRIILTALHSDYPKEDIVIISYDNNILLKAKNEDLPFVRMPDEYLLKQEPTEEEKELRRMREELNSLKNRLPNSMILLNEEDKCLTIKRYPAYNIDEETEEELAKVKKKYPYHKDAPHSDHSGVPTAVKDMMEILNQQFAKPASQYNTDLDDFFNDEKEFLHYKLLEKHLNDRFLPLHLSICNRGTDETGNLDVFIYFPQDVPFYNKESKRSKLVEIPLEPDKSSIYMSREDLKKLRSIPPLNGYANSSQQYFYLWDPDSPVDIDKLTFKVRNLNHDISMNLNKDKSFYIDTQKAPDFDIRWCIVDSKLPKATYGSIHVRFE